mgnify:CR=1 FL=1
MPVEVGQRVGPGTNLARVADPGRLKAELRIPETQARDVEIGPPGASPGLHVLVGDVAFQLQAPFHLLVDGTGREQGHRKRQQRDGMAPRQQQQLSDD